MARININLGTPPRGDDGDPVRTAFEKVNTMTTELYNGIDVANVSGWGKDKPRIMSATDSANNLPAVSGIFLFNNGGLDIPYPYVFIEQFTSGGGWIVQKAHAINSAGTWVRKYTPGNSAASLWKLDSIGGGSINGNVGATNLQMQLDFRNSIGIGTPYTYCKNIDAVTPAQNLILGYSYVMQDTVGTKPGGYVYGVVNTVLNASDHYQQDFVGLNGVAGVTQRAYRRSGYGSAWGPWRLVIDSASAIDVLVNDGGLMERAVVGDYIISKYANGTMTIAGFLGTVPGVPANTWGVYNAQLPSGIATVFGMHAWVTLTPAQNFDTYGVTCCYPTAGNAIRYVIRNGPTAQDFAVRVFAQGSWK